jgi:scyllo-inositol 2-dehydrogenase (NADP+)
MDIRRFLSRSYMLVAAFLLIGNHAATRETPTPPANESKIRFALVGLDHDHVWSLLKDLAQEPDAELVAIAESDSSLVDRAKKEVPAGVRFFSDYVQMLDEANPAVAIVTTSNDRHLEILRACAKRHIHYSTEKPMATSAADAREMERLADAAGIKLMVNYWNAWAPPTHALFHKVRAQEIGPVQRIIVQYGHRGPKEIGITQQFASWLYDKKKNGGGAIMDFGCYGAELSLWLKGRPARVFATTSKLKTEQHNEVDDDATILLEYPDATAVIEASWNWPYTKEQIEVFGSKGSFLATHQNLYFRSADAHGPNVAPSGEALSLDSLPHEATNIVAYLIDRVRNNKPIDDLLSARLNVQVMEILDAARESARTGKVQELH